MTHHGAVLVREARPLRFLLLCVGGWTLLRVAAHWTPAAAPPDPSPSPFGPVPTTFAATTWPGIAGDVANAATDGAPPRHRAWLRGPEGFSRRPEVSVAATQAPVLAGDSGQADRHGLRAALIARLFPASPGGSVRAAMRASRADWYPVGAAERAPPGQGRPYWMRRQLAGWSLGGWVYLRGGALAAPEAIAAAGQLGGSQAGLRAAYGLGDTGRARVYGRATLALRRTQQRELAFGLAFAPVAHWPVDVIVEQRLGIGREGRSAIAAMVTGGVGDVALPHDFRLEAYAQAGIVGARRRDGFADGAVVVDRRIGPDETAPVRVGALAAGAIQPGAARLDVGPRVTVRLPHVGEGSRIALDWRQRVAGDAQPESGLALTLASDF